MNRRLIAFALLALAATTAHARMFQFTPGDSMGNCTPMSPDFKTVGQVLDNLYLAYGQRLHVNKGPARDASGSMFLSAVAYMPDGTVKPFFVTDSKKLCERLDNELRASSTDND
ncbi:hypothetical protein [Burkholderia sp. Se-20378]|uniref:hypothetical protein n=1 Tax=Burkholderia sp. Se-20378 TaxID=2703899 RepID=UPI0019805A85|nr:hypothetical protein [Burkholderia sp. Se-20378]MBN3770722.1 hypothetical protein [Burkholderia sp. Se-20378]